MRTIVVLLCLFLCACGKSAQTVRLASDQAGAYVILPANFIIDVAAGAKVRLNPARQEFILYPDPEQARKALVMMEEGEIGENWRVYLLEGEFNDLARKCGVNYCLDQSCLVADWLQ